MLSGRRDPVPGGDVSRRHGPSWNCRAGSANKRRSSWEVEAISTFSYFICRVAYTIQKRIQHFLGILKCGLRAFQAAHHQGPFERCNHCVCNAPGLRRRRDLSTLDPPSITTHRRVLQSANAFFTNPLSTAFPSSASIAVFISGQPPGKAEGVSTNRFTIDRRCSTAPCERSTLSVRSLTACASAYRNDSAANLCAPEQK